MCSADAGGPDVESGRVCTLEELLTQVAPCASEHLFLCVRCLVLCFRKLLRGLQAV